MVADRIAFFDRDGVLNVNKGYVHRIEDFEWMPGAIEAIRYVASLGWIPIVVTNQSGVARGYYGVDDVERLHQWMNQQLSAYGVKIEDFYYCPYLDGAADPRYAHPNHPDRKPNPGMLQKALSHWGIEPVDAFIVGDNDSDIEAGRSAGVRGFKYLGGDLLEAIRRYLNQEFPGI